MALAHEPEGEVTEDALAQIIFEEWFAGIRKTWADQAHPRTWADATEGERELARRIARRVLKEVAT